MTGEFDGASLDALHAMIAFARPGELTTTAEALSKAAPKLAELARDLRRDIALVAWEGAAGDAFRAWGADLVTQTLLLGDYTQTAATELTRSGQALREAQSALPKPTGRCFANPEQEAARVEAETGPKLQEAIRQMERLSSYYRVAKEHLDAAREPRFLPIGDHLDAAERLYPARSEGSPTSAAPSPAWSGSAAGFREAAVPSPKSEYSSRVDAGGEMRLDSGVGVTGDDALTPSPIRMSSERLQTSASEPMAMPLVPGVAVAPQADGVRDNFQPVGGEVRTSNARSGSTAPRTAVSPEGRSAAGPRRFTGTVIGDAAFGVGAGSHAGAGASPAARPAVGDRTSSSTRPTIAGGAGFVPPAASLAGSGDRRSSNSRPPYLVEDTEVWTAGQRRVVPPVID